MLKTLMLAGAAMIAAPVLAQATAAPKAAQPAAPATPAPAATPDTSATPAAPATPDTAQAPAAEPANASDAVAALISADWAKYDKDGNGGLSKEEFAAWMTALREQNPAQKAAVTDVAAWTEAAFTMADKDKSGAVTKSELETFLKG